MKLKYNYSTLSKRSIVDKDTGLVSIIDIIDRVDIDPIRINALKEQGAKNIILLPDLVLTIVLDKDETIADEVFPFELQVLLRTPDKPTPTGQIFKLKTSKDGKNHRIFIKFNNFVYDGMGEYTYEIKMRETEEGAFKKIGENRLEITENK